MFSLTVSIEAYIKYIQIAQHASTYSGFMNVNICHWYVFVNNSSLHA